MTANSQAPKRLVLKIGSSTLTTSASSIDLDYMDMLTSQLANLRRDGWQVVLVSSGAIACGLGKLGIKERPTDIPSLQAAASVGQTELVAAYSESFGRHGIIASQVLLTRRDTADRNAYLHARDTFDTLLKMGVVPIVNENDTVSVEQIRFGDNDSLAALVACLIDATLLVIGSDIDGLYSSNPSVDPDAKLIPLVEKVDRSIMDISGGAGSVAGSGGMLTKVQAARIMLAAGIPLAIVNGKRPDAVADTANGECPGTLFASGAKPHTITPRKLWLALGDSSRGVLVVDDGARNALINHGSSLLAVGVKEVRGRFEADDVVDIEDSDGEVIARGRVCTDSDEISLAAGKSSESLAGNHIVGHLAEKPIVHRDELMVFE